MFFEPNFFLGWNHYRFVALISVFPAFIKRLKLGTSVNISCMVAWLLDTLIGQVTTVIEYYGIDYHAREVNRWFPLNCNGRIGSFKSKQHSLFPISMKDYKNSRPEIEIAIVTKIILLKLAILLALWLYYVLHVF